MENASKALIMAASVLIAIVIISAFLLMMSNLTSYQESSYQSNLSAQIAEFNNQYTTYDRSNIRGSDMISLMNRIVDYNKRAGYFKSCSFKILYCLLFSGGCFFSFITISA